MLTVTLYRKEIAFVFEKKQKQFPSYKKSNPFTICLIVNIFSESFYYLIILVSSHFQLDFSHWSLVSTCQAAERPIAKDQLQY